MDIILDILTKAQEKIRNPKDWCQKALGQNTTNKPLRSSTILRATKYCAVGAVIYIYEECQIERAFKWRSLSYLDEAAIELFFPAYKQESHEFRALVRVNDELSLT